MERGTGAVCVHVYMSKCIQLRLSHHTQLDRDQSYLSGCIEPRTQLLTFTVSVAWPKLRDGTVTVRPVLSVHYRHRQRTDISPCGRHDGTTRRHSHLVQLCTCRTSSHRQTATETTDILQGLPYSKIRYGTTCGGRERNVHSSL